VKIRTRYILSLAFIYLALAMVSIAIYPLNRKLFMVCEGLVVVCALLTFIFFRAFTRPFRILNAGIESIKDQDFSIKFLHVGQPDLDRLLDVYNRMIKRLMEERTITSEKNFLLGKLIDASIGYFRTTGKKGSGDFIDALLTALERMENLNSFTGRFSEICRSLNPRSVSVTSGSVSIISWSISVETWMLGGSG
jgi:hypothetical protein